MKFISASMSASGHKKYGSNGREHLQTAMSQLELSAKVYNFHKRPPASHRHVRGEIYMYPQPPFSEGKTDSGCEDLICQELDIDAMTCKRPFLYRGKC